MYAQQPPTPIKVRHKSSTSTLFMAAGGVLLLLGLLLLLTGQLTFWLILGPLLLVAGVVSLSSPFMTYDPSQGALYVHGPFGNRARTFGAPKGQRLYFDGQDIMRMGADGKTKRVRTSSGRPEEVQQVQQLIAASQQQG